MSAPSLLTGAIALVLLLHAVWRLRKHSPPRFERQILVQRPSLPDVPRNSLAPSPDRKHRAWRSARVRPRAMWRGGRVGARMATIVVTTLLVLLNPTLAAPPFRGEPTLTPDPGVAEAGTTIDVSGDGFEAHQEGVLTLDGDASGMPAYRVRGNGTFDEIVAIPADAALGSHVIGAALFGASGELQFVASAAITVSGSQANPPTPVPPIDTPVPTPANSPSPSPTATPVTTPTPSPTPGATPTIMPTPIPTPTPGGIGSGVDHLFIIVMENHDYADVWNTAQTPYTTGLADANARAANYFAITHPSLPNYLDLYAGSDYGITDDCNPSSSCHSAARNLADNLEAAGLTWKGYFENMPAPCTVSDSGSYIAHHNPFIYFDDIRTDASRCAAHVVPYGVLTADLASPSTTPGYALIVPNNCHNTHDCAISTGDAWLAANVPPILASPACTTERCLVILTWDENDGTAGNQVLTVFAGSAARAAAVSGVRYDHFSLLRTVEMVLGLPTQTGNDGAAAAMSDLLR
jgi:hypothetical protein